jgi:molybdenum cofactor cytidylyltransferase
MTTHAAILLAAGASRRLGQPKAMLRVDGETLIHRSVRMMLATHPALCLVMVGHPASAELITAELADLPVRIVSVPQWQQGMSASLRAGLAMLPNTIMGALVIPCDLPALSTEHLSAICAQWQCNPDMAVASAYQNIVATPALLPRRAFASLMNTQGDQGAREWLRTQPNVIAIRNEQLARDVDVASDLPVSLSKQ